MDPLAAVAVHSARHACFSACAWLATEATPSAALIGGLFATAGLEAVLDGIGLLTHGSFAAWQALQRRRCHIWDSFHGCQMIGLIPYIPVGQNLAHPACQCGTRPQFIPGSRCHYRGGGDIKHGSTVRFVIHEEADEPDEQADEPDEQADEPVAAKACTKKKKKVTRIRRKIKAPWWVSRTTYPKSILQASGEVRDPVTEHPRWRKISNIGRGICRRRCKVAVVNNMPHTEINKL